MIAPSHYDNDTLNRFLDDSLGDEAEPITAHIESCEACQARVESLVQQSLTWQDVSELFDKSYIDSRIDQQPGMSTDGVNETECLTASPSFLDSTDYAGSLGRFDRFEIMEILGRGGMGIVMRGYDTLLDRHCALKVLAPELATSAAARKRFSREAKSAAAVVHSHVVPIQTVDEHNGLPYLVMPVVEGQSLQQRVERDGPLPIIETIRIAMQVAEGLSAAHTQGLVHRDIKPANILLENGVERVQITDFGLARAVDDASMTRSGVIAGTPQYMSPEQAHGDDIDSRSDLFSLGSVVYFMLTGRSPFRAETMMGVLNRIGNDQPRSLRSINTDVPRWLEEIVDKLLSKSRDDRHQTASEVAQVLQERHAELQRPNAKGESSPDPLPASANPTRPSRKLPQIFRWLAGLAMFGCLALAGVVLVLELNKGTLTIESEIESVPIRIMQGDSIVKELTISKGAKSVRIAAGNYVVVIDGETDGIVKDRGVVQLKRGDQKTVKITLDEADGFQHIKDALVVVEYSGTMDDASISSTAIGWVVGDRGHIILPTCLIPKCDQENIELRYADGARSSAKRQGVFGNLTLLAAEVPGKVPTVPLGAKTKLAYGSKVFAILNGTDEVAGTITNTRKTIVVSKGEGWSINPPLRFPNAITTDFVTDDTTLSGVPLLTDSGDVAGMLINVPDQGMLAIPVAEVELALEQLSKTRTTPDASKVTAKPASETLETTEATDTELEGEWHKAAACDEHGVPQEVRPYNMTFKGNRSIAVWAGGRHESTIQVHPDTKNIWYSIEGEEDSFFVDQYELDGDKLILKDDTGAGKRRSVFERGLVRIPKVVPPVTDPKVTRWRSAIVKIYSHTPEARPDVYEPMGLGVIVRADGTLVLYSAKMDVVDKTAASLRAVFDDGSDIPLELVAENSCVFVLRPKDSVVVNHHFPIVDCPLHVDDEVYVGHLTAPGLEPNGVTDRLDAKKAQLVQTDRRVATMGVPVWQLKSIEHILNNHCMPVLSGDGELQAITMTYTRQLLLAIPTARLIDMFPAQFGPEDTKAVPGAGDHGGMLDSEGAQAASTSGTIDMESGKDTDAIALPKQEYETLPPEDPDSPIEATQKAAFKTPETLMDYYADCQFRDDVAGCLSCYSDDVIKQFATSYLLTATGVQEMYRNANKDPKGSRQRKEAEQQRKYAERLDTLLKRSMIDQPPAIAKTALYLAAGSILDELNSGQSREPTQKEMILAATSPSLLKNPRQFVLEFSQLSDEHSDNATADDETADATEEKVRNQYSIESDSGGTWAIHTTTQSRFRLERAGGRWWIQDVWPDDEAAETEKTPATSSKPYAQTK
ncbi:MAG: hypothetical protein Aurels2KO_40740 [Aureliella sp.]